jgi:hypothetical protein
MSEFIIEPDNYSLFNVDLVDTLPEDYPDEFKSFCAANEIKPPKPSSSTGKAWCLMTTYKYNYFNREVCEQIKVKFNIKSNDIIQQFNKVSQRGIKSSSDLHDKGKSYIVYPYQLSNKYKMRKNFEYSGSEEDKHKEINQIKSTIKSDYIDIPTHLWQLGHKNPETTDSSSKNLVLQPPIQARYRDDYIFIDTLTKFPCPHKLLKMIKNKEILLTPQQIENYKKVFDNI